MKAAKIMPAMLFQKPHPRSRAKDHTIHLDRRLQLSIFSKAPPSKQIGPANRSNFAKLMMEGRVKAALRLISNDNNGGPLDVDSHVESGSSPTTLETVREALLKKHPPKQPPKPSVIIFPGTHMHEPHPVLFETIDGPLIRRTILRMDGAAGPSGLYRCCCLWKRLCTSFKAASADLCEALASVARCICSSYVDPSGLTAFNACRLVALNKCPGVRPIGIRETPRRIIGKAIANALIHSAPGPLQLCAGHLSGCEAVVHAMHQLAPETEAVILVDATNAFNSLNRRAALQNIHHLCPSLSKILTNTYREDVQLFIDGETILSQEGTTQGESYGIPCVPLHRPILCVRPIPLSYVGHMGQSYGIPCVPLSR